MFVTRLNGQPIHLDKVPALLEYLGNFLKCMDDTRYPYSKPRLMKAYQEVINEDTAGN